MSNPVKKTTFKSLFEWKELRSSTKENTLKKKSKSKPADAFQRKVSKSIIKILTKVTEKIFFSFSKKFNRFW